MELARIHALLPPDLELVRSAIEQVGLQLGQSHWTASESSRVASTPRSSPRAVSPVRSAASSDAVRSPRHYGCSRSPP
ncbi:hypothetical protein [Agromyces humatus]|uniref:hypothetical protein n=1 Tax=Agromyces humatus TaxID=279573 RepID=UPI00355800AA